MAVVSVVIRTYNEEKHLYELLRAVSDQKSLHTIEIVMVDSGSTDKTLQIANSFGVTLVNIKKSDFTFGRSLNFGCNAAKGDYLIFISGHCIPENNQWIVNLVKPFENPEIAMSYGRQIGTDDTKFSEHQIFAKYFPEYDKIPQEGFFSNNANSAIRKSLWKELPFDEELTGLEDMYWSKEMCNRGFKIAYSSKAAVYHIHEESWRQVRIRYEREAIALQAIMPEIHLSIWDFMRYVTAGVFSDVSKALEQKKLLGNFFSIVAFRTCQFYGSYRGNHEHRKLSKHRKETYFYPTK
ncbi:MAG: glycosyltransferase [Flavobacteriales bacterium]|nr:glycosyltransferase [Flavobacteriales bacterium]